MKKQNRKKINDEKPVTLGDLLNETLMKQLKEKKTELKEQENQKKQLEEERKKEERRLKEKNKSFEELFNDSPLNWKDYK